jgi:hypothetical protein
MGFLNKRKVAKTVSYYITEVLIVTFGIFIAIQLNNWNEDTKNIKNGVSALKRIKTDLRTEKYVLNSLKQKQNYSRNYLINILYKNKHTNIDSIPFHFAPFVHYKMNSEYINLKSSGQLSLIKNDKLRYSLVNFYEVYYGVYNELEEYHKNFIYNSYQNYLKNNFTSDTISLLRAREVKDNLNDIKFRDILNTQINSLQYLNENLFIENIDQLLKKIDEELNKK